MNRSDNGAAVAVRGDSRGERRQAKPPSPRAPRRELVPGETIEGRYRLGRPIGTGGMATIWEATHLRLRQTVAIKFIDIAGPQRRNLNARFLREAQVAAAVRHRNVVDIIDFGTDAKGRPFMVMELLRGRTLAERWVQGPAIQIGDAVSIMSAVLSGLSAVHQSGIVHRDLKPENIFLVDDGDVCFPKLLDFGVSRSVDPESGLKSVLPTTDNAIVGTPQYMSPEQARGLKDLDHRSDIWSAGVILFELMTGVLPYDADAIGDVIVRIATADPPDFAMLRPDLAGPLEKVVKTAMNKDPARRFQSAREMRRDLLAAAAQLARRLSSRPTKPMSSGLSGPPAATAAELAEAVDAAFVGGDESLVRDLSEELQQLRAAFAVSRAAPTYASAPPSDPGSMPTLVDVEPAAPTRAGSAAISPPRDVELPEVELSSVDLVSVEVAIPPVPAKREPRWLLALLAIGLAGAAAGILWAAGNNPPTQPVSRPPPPRGLAVEEPDFVTVQLDGLDEDAEVFVDGQGHSGELRFPRSDEEHRIEVRSPDGRTFTVRHHARYDGVYSIELPPVSVEDSVGPASQTRARARRRRPVRPRRATGLIRDPGI